MITADALNREILLGLKTRVKFERGREGRRAAGTSTQLMFRFPVVEIRTDVHLVAQKALEAYRRGRVSRLTADRPRSSPESYRGSLSAQIRSPSMSFSGVVIVS